MIDNNIRSELTKILIIIPELIRVISRMNQGPGEHFVLVKCSEVKHAYSLTKQIIIAIKRYLECIKIRINELLTERVSDA